MAAVRDILTEDTRRMSEIRSIFDPMTGEGAPVSRFRLDVPDFEIPVQWLPESMRDEGLVRMLQRYGSLGALLNKELGGDTLETRSAFTEMWVRRRILHDFAFWAYAFVRIKPKKGGEDIAFRLNRPQRRLVEKFEAQRLAGKPIRVVVLKARQWGGSTVTQLYMSWLQLVHKKGWNSLIVGHQNTASVEVKGMFDKMIAAYPTELLHDFGATYNESEPKMHGTASSTNIHIIPSRNCKVKLGSAESPDSARGGDAALVHCTEIAFWKTTEQKTPEQIIRSACSGVLPLPLTMIVYESTANGTGNMFHAEYLDAKAGRSMFDCIFIAWWQIEQNSMPFATEDDRNTFATWLLAHKDEEEADNSREEPGRYYWRLWEMGATLEALNWYRTERRKYTDHGDIAAEAPSDDVEAFVHSGAHVFDTYKVDELRKACRNPRWHGEIRGAAEYGPDSLNDLHFNEGGTGCLRVWEKPEMYDDETVRHRYLVSVDIGGRSNKADYSVITVFDRYWMMEGCGPVVVAEWYGHTAHHLLAWKAAQIAKWYDNALLVIESNTLETKDKERDVDGDQSGFILNQIRDAYENLYARKQSEEEIVQGMPRRYGFHTNTKTKPIIISHLIMCVEEQLWTERNGAALEELLRYERKQNGSYGAVSGAHDDLLMARAIGLHVCYNEMELPVCVKHRIRKQRVHSGSMAEI